jgi:hypothetical protein
MTRISDLIDFFEAAAKDDMDVKVTMVDGEVFEGFAFSLDEGDDEHLGYMFKIPDGPIKVVYLKDIATAERVT